jgi:hypothetical protein
MSDPSRYGENSGKAWPNILIILALVFGCLALVAGLLMLGFGSGEQPSWFFAVGLAPATAIFALAIKATQILSSDPRRAGWFAFFALMILPLLMVVITWAAE